MNVPDADDLRPNKIVDKRREICCRNIDVSVSYCRYGIRVDPRQWFVFLSGKSDGGEEYPSLLLICCE
jgi:hypothetical protein